MAGARPLLALLGAAAAGYLVATVLRRRAPRLLRRRFPGGRWVVTAAAAVAALAAPGAPTGLFVADALLRAALASGVTVFAGGARRGAWLVSAALAAAAAGTGAAAVVAFGLLGAALAWATAPRWSRAVSSAFGAVLAQVLLRLERPTTTGATAAVAGAAVLVLAVSWWRRAAGGERRRARVVATGLGGLLAAATALGAGAAGAAAGDLDRGIGLTEGGLAAARSGDLALAAERFGAAATSLEDARTSLAAWWSAPSRAAPVVGRYLADLEALSGAAADAARAAGRFAELGHGPGLRVVDGSIDLRVLPALRRALDDATGQLEALRRVAATPRAGSWLPAPADARLDELIERIDRSLVDADVARLAIEVAPGLLGDEAPRRWFVAIHTPAEQRASGGVIGHWAELVADDGALDLLGVEPLGPLSRALPDTAELPPELAEPLARYDGFPVTRHLNNAMLTPDFPLAAASIEALVPQAGRPAVEGVIGITPVGLAALLEVVGPIETPAWPVPIDAANAASVLMHEHYVAFDDPVASDEFLDDVAGEVFGRLTSGAIGTPADLARALGPALAGRHVAIHSTDPVEQAALARLGVAGELLPADGGDFLQVVTQNATESKMEWFLRRRVSYVAEHDPATGEVHATLELALRNEAPARGLPAYVTGDDGGVLRTWLSIYSALDVEAATIDGAPLALSRERELGRDVYAEFVTIPPGSVVTIRVELRGALQPGAPYRLTVGTQPQAHADLVTVEVRQRGTPGDVRTGYGPLPQVSPVVLAVDDDPH